VGLGERGNCWLELMRESLSCGIIMYFDVMFLYNVNSMVMFTKDSAICRGGECNIPILKPQTSDVYCKYSMWLRAKQCIM
jgi:hypothetical protein